MLRNAAIAFALVLLPSFAYADIPTPTKLTGPQRSLLASRLNADQCSGAKVYRTQDMPRKAMSHLIGISGGTQVSVTNAKVRAKQHHLTANGPFQPQSIILYGPFALSAGMTKATPTAPWVITSFNAVNTRPRLTAPAN